MGANDILGDGFFGTEGRFFIGCLAIAAALASNLFSVARVIYFWTPFVFGCSVFFFDIFLQTNYSVY